jgi:hypothetical protein
MSDCLCGRECPKRVGDPVEVGDVLGFSIEAGMRYGRVVGRIKPHVKLESMNAARVIVREFRPGDGRWPTGDYNRSWLMTPWDHDHPQTALTEYQEPVDWKDGPFR